MQYNGVGTDVRAGDAARKFPHAKKALLSALVIHVIRVSVRLLMFDVPKRIEAGRAENN